jgi:hypothetical protein
VDGLTTNSVSAVDGPLVGGDHELGMIDAFLGRGCTSWDAPGAGGRHDGAARCRLPPRSRASGTSCQTSWSYGAARWRTPSGPGPSHSTG